MRTTTFTKKTDAFIETGSYFGAGIDLALATGFNEIYSIELAEYYYHLCLNKFGHDPRVNLILGDSYNELEKLLATNEGKPFTYWLDGHFCGNNTGFGVKESPLLKELETILSRGVTGELIYIDDMRIYRDFDEELNQDSIYNVINKYVPDAERHYEASPHDSEDILVINY